MLITVREMAAFESVFELDGAREAVDEGRASVLLTAALTKCGAAPSHLRLSNKSFSEGAARVIATGLRERCMGSVRVADLSDIIAGKSEEEALEVLRIICDALDGCAIVDLNLSDNALGRPGVLACNAVLSGKHLEKLYVCNDGLSAEAAVTLHEILAKDGMPALSVFHFFNNMSGDGGALAVADIVRACPLLVDFRFSATRSQRPGCLAIAQALVTHPSGVLRSLDLGDCMFGGEAATQLATAIANQKALISLNLRDAGLSEEGLVNVLKVLPNCSGLTHLDLSGDGVEGEEAVALLVSVCASLKDTLRELSLDDNAIESDGAIVLAKALSKNKNSALHSLSLCTCELTAAGANALAKAVAKLPSFSTLKLDGNAICSRGVEEISGVLLRAGKILGDLEDNDEDGDDDLDEDEGEGDEDEEEEDESGADDLAAALAATKLEP